MPMSDQEVTESKEVYLGYEDDGNGGLLPTLYDPKEKSGQEPPHNAVRAVWLVGTLPDQIEVHTDPEVVAQYLDQ